MLPAQQVRSRCFVLQFSAITYALIAAFAKEISMLWTIAVLLLILWALGMVSSYTLGGFIHILLVLAIVVVLIRVIQGRSPVV